MAIKLIKFFLTLSIGALLLNGCVNSNMLENPNTQTGAAIGAVTGAVIGKNLGDGSGSNLAAGAVLGALAGGAMGEASTTAQPVQRGGWQ